MRRTLKAWICCIALCAAAAASTSALAQSSAPTAEQTMKWLDATIAQAASPIVAKHFKARGSDLYVGLQEDKNGSVDYYQSIAWKDVKSVRVWRKSADSKNYWIGVTGKVQDVRTYDTKTLAILDIYLTPSTTLSEAESVAKAMRYLANLNGASLVKETLFDALPKAGAGPSLAETVMWLDANLPPLIINSRYTFPREQYQTMPLLRIDVGEAGLYQLIRYVAIDWGSIKAVKWVRGEDKSIVLSVTAPSTIYRCQFDEFCLEKRHPRDPTSGPGRSQLELFSSTTDAQADAIVRAMKHLATLKGATFAQEGLF